MPHVLAATIAEWGSAKHRIFDLSYDIIQADVYDTGSQMPMSMRNHPVPGSLWTVASFKTFLVGSGAGAGAKTPPMGTLFEASALGKTISTTVSTTYAWTGDLPGDTVAADIDFFIGNAMKVPSGSSVANCSIEFLPGQPAVCSFDTVGKYTLPTEAASAASAETAGLPFPCKNLACTVGGKTLVLKRVFIDLRNENNSPNYDINGTNGVDGPDLTNSNPMFSITAELPAFSTVNYWTNLLAETKTDLALVVGTGASNINTFAMSGYAMSKPTVSDVNGIAAISCDFQMGTAAADTLFNLICT